LKKYFGMHYVVRCLFFLVLVAPISLRAQFQVYNYTETGALINEVSSIYVAGNGQAWIGTDADGLHFVDADVWTSYSSGQNGFPNDYVSRVKFVDNKIIVTTRFNGAAYYNGSGWTAWSVPSQIMDSEVRDVAKDAQDNVWFPTYQGISRDSTRTGIWKNYTTASFAAMPTNYFHNVFVDTNNDKWFGSIGDGIFILRSGSTTSTVYTTSNGLPSNEVNKVIKVGSDYWVATNSGLAVLSGSTWTVQNSGNNSQFAGVTQVRDLLRASNGKVYLATDNGLVYYDNGNWGRKDNVNSNLPENNLTALGYDEVLNDLWVGTSASGVAKVSQSSLTTSIMSASDAKVSIYPNPVQHELFIQGVPDYLQITAVELLSAEGTSIIDFQKDDFYNRTEVVRFELPSTLATGLYVLKIETADGLIIRKIIKQ
jgi:ligand-binding sensor domain-containing protein